MRGVLGALALCLCSVSGLADDTAPARCADLEIYGMLDFWVGEWEVYAGDEKVGDNRIEKVLSGCAVMEHWKGADGGEGKSLFFVDSNALWQQVWVTEWATSPGGIKQKTRVENSSLDGVRFLGRLQHPDSGSYLDRTTLTPKSNGDVRQVIEISTDDGKTWKTTFDAVYRRTVAD